MNEQGLWFGIICGLMVQVLLLMAITLCTNWDKEVCMQRSILFFLTIQIDSSMAMHVRQANLITLHFNSRVMLD